MRYLCRPSTRPINVTKIARKAEVDAARSAGLAVGLVWQDGKEKPDVLRGHAGGRLDGAEAARQATELGYPRGCVIFIAVDFRPRADQLATIEDYFLGFLEACPHPLGAYGDGALIDRLLDRNLVVQGWHVASWGTTARAHLRQHGPYVTVGGVTCDPNDVLADGLAVWVPTPTVAAPVPSAPMGFYLLEHENPHGEHFYRTRNGSILAIVVHITAGLQDLDGVADQSAERTAAYCASTDRKVSWHSGSDSDSVLELLPSGFTAWHAKDYNSRTYGHEISKTSPDWRNLPGPWMDATLRRAAEHLGPMARTLGIPVRHATKTELDRAIATNGAPVGFVAHADLDPDDRRDPGYIARPPAGDTFPWNRFLDLVGRTPASPPAPSPKETDPMHKPTDVLAVLPTPDGGGRWLLTADGGIRTTGTAKFLGSVPGLPEAKRLGFPGAEIILPHAGGYEIVDLKGNSYHFPAK